MVRRFEFADPGEVERMGNGFPIWKCTEPKLSDHHPRGAGHFHGWLRVGQMGPRTRLGSRRGRPPAARQRPLRDHRDERHVPQSYASRRCLVPVDGYFEWQKLDASGKKKQPYAIAMKDDEPFAMAGIWEEYSDKGTGELIRTFAIATCEPNELMATIHDRMPVILAQADYMRWLGPEPDPRDLMKPFPSDLMKMWPIGSKVGSPSNNTPDIIDEIGRPDVIEVKGHGPDDLFDV